MEPKVSQRLSVVNSQRAKWRLKRRERGGRKGDWDFCLCCTLHWATHTLYKHSPFPVAHDQKPSALVGRPGHVRAGCKWEVLRAGGVVRVGAESACKFAGYIYTIYLPSHWGVWDSVCETQSVCVCELAVCTCTCCLSKNYAPRSPMPQQRCRLFGPHAQAQAEAEGSQTLPSCCLPGLFLALFRFRQFVCLRLVVCNAFATVLTVSADCTANLPHYPHACNNLQLSSMCRRCPTPSLPPFLHMKGKTNFFKNF